MSKKPWDSEIECSWSNWEERRKGSMIYDSDWPIDGRNAMVTLYP